MLKSLRQHLHGIITGAIAPGSIAERDSTVYSMSSHTVPQWNSQDPLQQRLFDKVEACYQIAEQHFDQTFPRPEIGFKLRGRSAGTAHLQLNKLRFNPVLLTENQQAFIDEVVPHEICHLLCFQLFGRVKPHGKEWQSLMRTLFSLVPRTTHAFDTSSLSAAQIDYLCGCGPIKLSIRRHNKVRRGQTQYRCKRCQQILMTANSTR